MQKMANTGQTLTAPNIPGPDAMLRTPFKRLPVGSCDTHAHLFGPQHLYPYQVNRSYTPPDATEHAYRQMLQMMGFDRAVLVQPSVYGLDNSRLLNMLANVQSSDDIEWRGIAVVSDAVTDDELEFMHALGVRGIRINLVFPGGITFTDVQHLARRVSGLGWHIQFLVDVSNFTYLADRLSALPVDCVIDHMGHIPTEKTHRHPGFQELLALLKAGRTWVKLTGPNRISQLQHVPFLDVDPFFKALVETRLDRCLFGTDWPHVQLPTSMPNDADLVNEFLRLVPDFEQQHVILVQNPAKLYQFSV